MRLSFTEVGGPIPRPMSVELDTGSLSADDAAELTRLVHAADVFGLPDPPPASPHLRDARHTSLVVDDGGRRRELRFADGTMPGGLQPLVEWLRRRASPMPLR